MREREFNRKLAEFKEYLRTHDRGYPFQKGPHRHPLGDVGNIRAAVKRTADGKEIGFRLTAAQVDSLNAIDFVFESGPGGVNRSARFYEILDNEAAEAS